MVVGLSPAQRAAMQIEEGIRRNRTETVVFVSPDGAEVGRFRGDRDRVPIDEVFLRQCSGLTMTHNHPGNTSFSVADVSLAVEFGLEEVRVVTRRHRHSITGHQRVDCRELLPAFEAAHQQVVPHVRELLMLRRIGLNDSETEAAHRAWGIVASKLSFNYWRD